MTTLATQPVDEPDAGDRRPDGAFVHRFENGRSRLNRVTVGDAEDAGVKGAEAGVGEHRAADEGRDREDGYERTTCE